MSFEEMNPSFPSVGRSLLGEVYHKVNWLIGLGLLLVVLGALGLVGQVLFSFLSVGFIAAIFILAGIFQGVHTFQSKGWKSVTLQLLFTFIYAGLGVFMLVFPGAALEGGYLPCFYSPVHYVVSRRFIIVCLEVGLGHYFLDCFLFC